MRNLTTEELIYVSGGYAYNANTGNAGNGGNASNGNATNGSAESEHISANGGGAGNQHVWW